MWLFLVGLFVYRLNVGVSEFIILLKSWLVVVLFRLVKLNIWFGCRQLVGMKFFMNRIGLMIFSVYELCVIVFIWVFRKLLFQQILDCVLKWLLGSFLSDMKKVVCWVFGWLLNLKCFQFCLISGLMRLLSVKIDCELVLFECYLQLLGLVMKLVIVLFWNSSRLQFLGMMIFELLVMMFDDVLVFDLCLVLVLCGMVVNSVVVDGRLVGMVKKFFYWLVNMLFIVFFIVCIRFMLCFL